MTPTSWNAGPVWAGIILLSIPTRTTRKQRLNLAALAAALLAKSVQENTLVRQRRMKVIRS